MFSRTGASGAACGCTSDDSDPSLLAWISGLKGLEDVAMRLGYLSVRHAAPRVSDPDSNTAAAVIDSNELSCVHAPQACFDCIDAQHADKIELLAQLRHALRFPAATFAQLAVQLVLLGFHAHSSSSCVKCAPVSPALSDTTPPRQRKSPAFGETRFLFS
jgi:hypothetical protein